MLNRLVDKYFIKQPRVRRLITALLERDEDKDVTIAEAKLRINSRREHGYLRASRLLQKNGTLRDEIPVLMNLFSIIRDGDSFIDIGANTGLYTHSMVRLTRVYPNFHIVAVEANPDTFARLSHHPYDRVTYLNKAISDTNAELKFVDGAVSHVCTTVDKQNSYNIDGEYFTVPAVRLDDLELPSRSLVLKIDVEGQEANVLKGASRLLSEGHIRAVYVDGYEDDFVTTTLKNHGFSLLDGRTLETLTARAFSLLALKK